MTDATLDVVGIGNAIVDILVHSDDGFLESNGLVKGAMTMIDATRADALRKMFEHGTVVSGGSAANSMAGIAALGGRAAFIGKLRDDRLGAVFADDIRAAGVRFTTPPADNTAPTACCFVIVTPDAQRTMSTYLGACVEISPEDIDEALIAASAVTYLEGYLWDPPGGKAALRKACFLAHDNHRRVALSLSDSFCVERYRDEFLDLLANHVDILFANQDEIIALYQADNFDDALEQLSGLCEIAALTRGAQGSVVVAGDRVHSIPAAPVEAVIDTTGAGDLYAAGFLYGLTKGWDLAACARLGGAAAAEIIGCLGARGRADMAALAASLDPKG